MSSSDPRAARAALHAARSAVGRLDPAKHPEDLAADLLEAWTDVEGALRALLGGSAATGTELVREARQHNLLSFDQANALAAFHAARERTRETDYRPAAADVDVAWRAMAALDAAVDPGAAAPSAAPVPAGAVPPTTVDPFPMVPPGMRHSPLGVPEFVPSPEGGPSRRGLRTAIVATIVIVLAAGGAYYWFGGPRRDAVVRRAMSDYEMGQRDSAAAGFRRALAIDPNYAIAHVYLARIDRDGGNLSAANDELQQAINADPENAVALREMGAYLFTVGDFELARKFYVRAVAANPEDAASKGYLGCTLVRLGRIDEGERWITRAGPGVWTSCVSGATPPDTTTH